MMIDAKGNSLNFTDAVLVDGGTDVWYAAGYEYEDNLINLTLTRRGTYLKVPYYKVVKTDCPHGWDLTLSRDAMKMLTSEGTIGVTPPVDLKVEDSSSKYKSTYDLDNIKGTWYESLDMEAVLDAIGVGYLANFKGYNQETEFTMKLDVTPAQLHYLQSVGIGMTLLKDGLYSVYIR